MKVRITCEECGHVGVYEAEPLPELEVAEFVEDSPLRGFRSLPIAEPLDDE